jgi:hypothetical protein
MYAGTSWLPWYANHSWSDMSHKYKTPSGERATDKSSSAVGLPCFNNLHNPMSHLMMWGTYPIHSLLCHNVKKPWCPQYAHDSALMLPAAVDQHTSTARLRPPGQLAVGPLKPQARGHNVCMTVHHKTSQALRLAWLFSQPLHGFVYPWRWVHALLYSNGNKFMHC